MNETIAEALIELINSKPRSPTKAEIMVVLEAADNRRKANTYMAAALAAGETFTIKPSEVSEPPATMTVIGNELEGFRVCTQEELSMAAAWIAEMELLGKLCPENYGGQHTWVECEMIRGDVPGYTCLHCKAQKPKRIS